VGTHQLVFFRGADSARPRLRGNDYAGAEQMMREFKIFRASWMNGETPVSVVIAARNSLDAIRICPDVPVKAEEIGTINVKDGDFKMTAKDILETAAFALL
jgi:hypothetical protein